MSIVLVATERQESNRSSLRKIRESGYFPAVVYGKKVESKGIAVNSRDFVKTIREVGRNGIISLEVSGEKHDVMLADYQEDPLKNEVVHADFLAVDMSTEVTTSVRIVLVGESAGVKDGGVLQQSLHEVSVTAKPRSIPPSIDIDISNLQVGETINIRDLKENKDYSINHEDDEVIASVLAPRQEEEISTGEEQEAGIPENQEGRETEASNE